VFCAQGVSMAGAVEPSGYRHHLQWLAQTGGAFRSLDTKSPKANRSATPAYLRLGGRERSEDEVENPPLSPILSSSSSIECWGMSADQLREDVPIDRFACC
jgi:hypothetical protein